MSVPSAPGKQAVPILQPRLYDYGVTAMGARTDETALERLGRALADDSRRRILMADALGLGRANTSNHLSCLRGCGLVVAEPEGRRVRYELADVRLAVALRALADVVLSIDPDCAHER